MPWYKCLECKNDFYTEGGNTNACFVCRRKKELFVEHIKEHLKNGEVVKCPKCGKTIKEIWEEH